MRSLIAGSIGPMTAQTPQRASDAGAAATRDGVAHDAPVPSPPDLALLPTPPPLVAAALRSVASIDGRV